MPLFMCIGHPLRNTSDITRFLKKLQNLTQNTAKKTRRNVAIPAGKEGQTIERKYTHNKRGKKPQLLAFRTVVSKLKKVESNEVTTVSKNVLSSSQENNTLIPTMSCELCMGNTVLSNAFELLLLHKLVSYALPDEFKFIQRSGALIS